MIQQLAARVSRSIGRDHPLVDGLRPVYELLLDVVTGGRGFLRTVNQHESFYIDPQHRGLFPDTYEARVCEYLRNTVRPGDVCLNIGAHLGVYALCLSRWTEPDGRIFAFEPNPETRRVLISNLNRNSLTDRVTVVPFAVSDRLGQATFFASGLEGFSRLGEPNNARLEKHSRITVSLTTVDAFCNQYRVAPDWLIVDVEGYEAGVLQGARKTILERGENLKAIIEMHPGLWPSAGSSPEILEKLITDLGLVPRALSGQRDFWAENGQILLQRGCAAAARALEAH